MSTSSITTRQNHAINPLHETPTSATNNSSPPQKKPLGSALFSSAAIEPPRVRITIGESLGIHAQPALNQLSPTEGILFSAPSAPSSKAMNESLQRHMQGKKTDLLVVRGNIQVNKAFIESLQPEDRPKFVLRAGTGMNNIDTDYLDSMDIQYTNTPDVNTVATAELTIGGLFATARRFTQADQAIKQGEWNREPLTGLQLRGKTIGIIGLGAIGQEVASLAKANGMKVVGLRPRSAPKEQSPSGPVDRYADTVKELMPQINVLSVHIPLTKDTKKMIGKEELALMPEKSIVLNMARETVVDETALLDALNQGKLWGAAVDVFQEEKKNGVSQALATHPRVVATPHIGGQTKEACEAMGKAVVDQAKKMFLDQVVSSHFKQPKTH